MQQEDIDALVELRLLTRNNRLFSAIKEKDMTVSSVADELKMYYGKLSRIVNLRLLPTTKDMMDLSVLLSKPIEELFPETLLRAIEHGIFSPGKRKKFIDEVQLEQLTSSQVQYLITDNTSIEDEIDGKILHVRLDKTLQQLNPREREVLNLRYGLEDGIPRSLAQVGKELPKQIRVRAKDGSIDEDKSIGVTVERVRQIEARTLRKLRHPSRSKILRPFADDETVEERKRRIEYDKQHMEECEAKQKILDKLAAKEKAKQKAIEDKERNDRWDRERAEVNTRAEERHNKWQAQVKADNKTYSEIYSRLATLKVDEKGIACENNQVYWQHRG